MRGITTPVTKIRRRVFEEIARLAFEGGDYSRIEELPYKIIQGELPSYRDNIFKERAIVGERLRLAVGLPLRPVDQHAPVADGINDSAIADMFYDPPLVNVISFACNACEETCYTVTDRCRCCLAHPCTAVCPVQAISIRDGRSHIDKEKCVKCGRCCQSCPYTAIVKCERPCAASCGVDAIESDEYGRAKINYDKCVSCGQCLVNCPFGAIADKSQIFQLIQAIKKGGEIIAEVAPAFTGQFGPHATPEKFRAALLKLGFSEVYEVARGADIGAVEEAKEYIQHVASGELPFLATSCCPSWSIMAKTLFPEIAHCISDSLTPMVATARTIKEEHPNARVVFIGPCASKKLEAMRRTVRSDVDFVITFEELMGMFIAKGIEFGTLEDGDQTGAAFHPEDATSSGRGYGVAGGVVKAVTDCIKQLAPDLEVPTDRAESLRECRKMLTLAKLGKRNGYLLEGMACPGGCVGGAGTMASIPKAVKATNDFSNTSSCKVSALDPDVMAHVGKYHKK